MTDEEPKDGEANVLGGELESMPRARDVETTVHSEDAIIDDDAPPVTVLKPWPSSCPPKEPKGNLPTDKEGAHNKEEDDDKVLEPQIVHHESSDDGDEDGEIGEDEDDDEEDDDEPKLKYARLTQHLKPVYRKGDSTSTFLVASDKMIIGTHDGNIHVIQLPGFQPVRVYHAHQASVTSVSVSPRPVPLPSDKANPDTAPHSRAASISARLDSSMSAQAFHAVARRPRESPPVPNIVPNIPSNNIHIATSSMDGHVCVQSLVDSRDVTLRNFARPILAVAVSPDYKDDRIYISGGTAGQLILTGGAPNGRSTSTTTGGAAQAAGWLGSMVGAGSGKDMVLHSGEGTITTIKWSLSGKYVAWLNEHGIKIMRSKSQLEDSEDAWKRIGHIDRPQTDEWEAMATSWKGRLEWTGEKAEETYGAAGSPKRTLSPASERPKQQQTISGKNVERLLVGWGGTIWIIHVHPGGGGVGKHADARSAGRAEIMKILRMDCTISGISLYTPNLLLVLAFCFPEKDEEDAKKIVGHTHTKSTSSTGSQPSGGIPRRQDMRPPELRLIDLESQAEVSQDGLSVSRFERLKASDYHLGILPAQSAVSTATSRGALEALAGLGSDVWNAAINPRALFSSAASLRSKGSSETMSVSKASSVAGTTVPGRRPIAHQAVHPNLTKPGVKIFIHSPYDCILATKRDLGDHLQWLLEKQQYEQAWELVDENPEIVGSVNEYPPGTPDKSRGVEFLDDTASFQDDMRALYSNAEKEKRRIGELWVQKLIEAGDWTRAGLVCGKVLGTPDRWEKWFWRFASAKRFDEIVDYMPTEPLRPPIPGTMYEVVLGHYVETDKPRFKHLLERWSPHLFDINAVTTTLENQLKFRDVRQDSVDDGEVGRDWRIVMGSLGRLHEANGRTKEALRCYIRLQDADSAMRLIKESHLAEVVTDDIPSFIGLRVPMKHIDRMTREELEAATAEAITLLVDEAQHGLVKPDVVIEQLQQKELNLYIYFYLRGLWKGEGIPEHAGEYRARVVSDSQSLVDQHGDLAVHLFAEYDQALLMDFLKVSTAYSFETAAHECERHNYIPELVFLYSKTGRMKDALSLIIDRLGDVSRAIAFAKEQQDPDLWEDLLDYSMDKPRFIRGLLDEVGTAIDPVALVRRIPEGLEIQGLREGLRKMMKEHEIQFSISEGVARVLRSEVAGAQMRLREGQRRGIKFEVAEKRERADVEARVVPAVNEAGGEKEGREEDGPERARRVKAKNWQSGHCAECLKGFSGAETDAIVAFVCNHSYHLTHLLEALGQEADGGLLEFGGMGMGRSVGAKVTHARLLRDQVRGGCPICRVERGGGATTTKPFVMDVEAEYFVERIEDMRYNGRSRKHGYLVRCTGYDELSLEPAANLDAVEAVEHFHCIHPGTPKPPEIQLMLVQRAVY